MLHVVEPGEVVFAQVFGPGMWKFWALMFGEKVYQWR